MTNFLSLSCKTTGLEDNAKIVKLEWSRFTYEHITSNDQYIIKPAGEWTYTDEIAEINNLTRETIEDCGISFMDAWNLLKRDLEQVNCIVVHTTYVLKVLARTLQAHNVKFNFSKFHIQNTMQIENMLHPRTLDGLCAQYGVVEDGEPKSRRLARLFATQHQMSPEVVDAQEHVIISCDNLLAQVNGVICFRVGKYAGKPVVAVCKHDAEYISNVFGWCDWTTKVTIMAEWTKAKQELAKKAKN